MATTNFLGDLFALIARVGLGVVLILHGLQKFGEWTIQGTAQNFAQMGVPAPEIAAWAAALVELVGGVLLIAGLATRLVGILVAVVMAGAWIFAHSSAPTIFVGDGGPELVIVIAAGALLLAAFGAGRIAVDNAFARRKRVAA
ncbi:DoxX family protein [Corynebacterium sp. 335C]